METDAPLSEEVRAYRSAYASWRQGEYPKCVDAFGSFLQSFPESAEADDAMFWMADCLFKSGDYKYAVLRFDDVVQAESPDNGAGGKLRRARLKHAGFEQQVQRLERRDTTKAQRRASERKRENENACQAEGRGDKWRVEGGDAWR